MKILLSFTHPQVVPNLYECLCSAEQKGRYSEECGKRSSSGAPLTSIVFILYYGSQWCPRTADYKNSLEETPGTWNRCQIKETYNMCSVGRRPGPGLRNTNLMYVSIIGGHGKLLILPWRVPQRRHECCLYKVQCMSICMSI